MSILCRLLCLNFLYCLFPAFEDFSQHILNARYEVLHGGGGYLADRYVTLIFNFICLALSVSTEGPVQLRYL